MSTNRVLRMRNISDKVVKKIKTHFIFSNSFFKTFFKNHAIDDIMWKNIVEPDRSQMTVWVVRMACWIPRATNTHFWNM